MVKKDHLSAIALMKRTLLRQITHPFQVVFCSSDANTSCSFTRQDFTFKQAYCVSSCFVLLYEPNFCQLTLVFSAFYRIHSEITLFCTTPSWQIISCHVRRYIATIVLVYSSTALLPKFQEFVVNKCWREVSWYKNTRTRKTHLKFLN